MYGFRKYDYPTLRQAAIEAVSRIYSAGLMFRHGQLVPGGNNVMADNAAKGFNVVDLAYLGASADPFENGLGRVIVLRRQYGEACDSGDADAGQALQKIYDEVQILNALRAVDFGQPHAVGYPRPTTPPPPCL